MKQIISLLASIFLCNSMALAQFNYIKFKPALGFQIDNAKCFYSKYPDNYIFTIQKNKQELCNNTTPEETLISVFSSDNYDWEKSNYLYKISNDSPKYNQKKKMSIKNNNFKLIRKIELGFGEERFAIIKYHINENGNLKPYCSLFKYVNLKWLIDMPDLSISKLYLMFNYLSDGALDAIFLGSKTNILYFDEKNKELKRNGVFDLIDYMNYKPQNKMNSEETKILIDNLLLKSISSLSSLSSQECKDIIDFDNNKLSKYSIQLNYIKELSNQEYCYYVDNSYSNALVDSTLYQYEDFTNKNVPIAKFQFSYNDNSYSILKYSDSLKVEKNILYLKRQNKWIITSKQDNYVVQKTCELCDIIDYNTIQTLSTIEDTKDIRIETLKREVKDKNNVVNIVRLNQLLGK